MFKLLVILYKTNLYAQLSPSKIELQDFIQRQKKEIKTIKQKVRRQQRKIDSLSGLLEDHLYRIIYIEYHCLYPICYSLTLITLANASQIDQSNLKNVST